MNRRFALLLLLFALVASRIGACLPVPSPVAGWLTFLAQIVGVALLAWVALGAYGASVPLRWSAGFGAFAVLVGLLVPPLAWSPWVLGVVGTAFVSVGCVIPFWRQMPLREQNAIAGLAIWGGAAATEAALRGVVELGEWQILQAAVEGFGAYAILAAMVGFASLPGRISGWAMAASVIGTALWTVCRIAAPVEFGFLAYSIGLRPMPWLWVETLIVFTALIAFAGAFASGRARGAALLASVLGIAAGNLVAGLAGATFLVMSYAARERSLLADWEVGFAEQAARPKGIG
ncbi:MAG: hypothetical protein K8H99_05045 [Nitrospirae bacterium]|nr:hypothetical protein [Fimbriimonadaceae bacterium]